MLTTVEINKKVEKREKMRAEYRKKYKELKLLLETKYYECCKKSIMQKVDGLSMKQIGSKSKRRKNNSKAEMES